MAITVSPSETISITVTQDGGSPVTVGSATTNSVSVQSPAIQSVEVTSKGPKGEKGEKGEKGDNGADGPAGPGVAVGGATSTFLVKSSGDDYDTQWTSDLSSNSILNTNTIVSIGSISTYSQLSADSITTVGNVGVGTTSPSDKLDVSGNIKLVNTQDYIKFANDFVKIKRDGSNSLELSSYADFKFYNTETPGQVAVLKSDGSLGLGVSAPREKLEVDGNIKSTGDVLVDGNVGIGTTSPGTKLHVVGNSYVQGDMVVGPQGTAPISGYTLSIRDTVPSIYFKDQTGNVGDGRLHVNSNIFSIGVDPDNVTTDAVLRFETRASERMRIDHDGNVGIGTTTPATKLYVDPGDDAWAIQVPSYKRIGWDGGAAQYLTGWSSRIAFHLGGLVGEAGRFSSSGDLNKFVVERAIHLGENSGDTGDTRFTRLGTGIVAIGNNADDASGTLAVGNVGIGTTTPDKQLTLYEGVTNEKAGLDSRGIYFSRISDGAYTGTIVADTGGNPTYSARNNHKFLVNSQQTLTIRENTNFASSGVVSVGPIDNIGISQNLFSVQGPVGIGSSVAYYRDNSTTNGLLVEGNVGIGTISPSEKLHVVGNGKFEGQLQVENTDGNLGITTNATAVTGYGNTVIGVGSSITGGDESTVIGNINTTSYNNTINIGRINNTVGGSGNIILGKALKATGANSIVMGYNQTVGNGSVSLRSGDIGDSAVGISSNDVTSYSVGIGDGVTASNNYAVAIGLSANTSGTSGAVAIGHPAKAVNAGVSIGLRAGQNSSGVDNILIGTQAGYNASAGLSASNCIAIGQQALRGEATASNTIAIGYQALTNLTTGGANTAIGYQAGDTVTTGNNNVLIGYGADVRDGSNGNNTIIGANPVAHINAANQTGVGNAVKTGNESTAIGSQAGSSSSTRQVAIGYNAGANSGTSTSAVLIGYFAGQSATALGTIAIGHEALKSATGTGNTAVGYQASKSLTTSLETTAIGYQAGLSGSNGASYNTYVGYKTGTSGTSAQSNTMIGWMSGTTNSTGDNNTAIGTGAAIYLLSGSGNVAIGSSAMYNNSTGSDNVMIGNQSGRNATGSSNVFIGHDSGYSETGSNKLYIENSDSSTPLIYGEFDNDIVRINGDLQVTGDTEVLGYVESKSIKVDDTGLSAAGDYGKSAEIWYQGAGATTAGSLYYLNSSGDWANTDASAASTAKGMLAFAAGTDSDVDGMITKGFVYLGTDPGGSVGDQVFLSETANAATATAPSTSGAIVRVIGHKVATNVIYFNPSNDYFEVE